VNTPAPAAGAIQRPLLVTLLGWMLILVGAIEGTTHAALLRPPFHAADFWLPLFELVILVCGIYLLRGANWARWLALAWIGFHVVVGSLNSVLAGVLHGLAFLLFVWLMVRPEVNAWFRRPPEPAP
jgi:hypothetical protein